MKVKILFGFATVLAVAVLVVSQGRPIFKLDYEIITGKEGSNVVLKCFADGEPPIDYNWFKLQYSLEVLSDERIYKSVQEQEKEEVSVFEIKKVTSADEGLYTCTARNKHGLASKTFELQVIPLSNNTDDETDDGKSRISKTEIANVTSTSVLFSIKIVGSAKTIEVKYNEIREGIVRTTQWKNGDRHEIKDLIPGGSYRFQFRLALSSSSEWSKEYQVILLPDTPEVIFRNLEGGNLQIGWNRKFDDTMRKTIDRYELTYFTVQMQGVNSIWVPSNCPITVLIPSCSNNYYTLTGLPINAYYEIQLKAHTAAGYGEPFKQKIYSPRT